MVSEHTVIDWSKYPVRTCYSMHECLICGSTILNGHAYRDGGYGKRAHERCVCGDMERVRKAAEAAAKLQSMASDLEEKRRKHDYDEGYAAGVAAGLERAAAVLYSAAIQGAARNGAAAVIVAIDRAIRAKGGVGVTCK